MIKPFHELTKEEFAVSVSDGMTWRECAKQYPQPKWCHYPQAVAGEMGCWTLMAHMVKGPETCDMCELFIHNWDKTEESE